MSHEELSITLPDLGEGIEQAKLVSWNYKVGDYITQDDDVAEVVTDKATFHIPSSCTGKIREICVLEGQEANIGQVLAIIDPLEV